MILWKNKGLNTFQIKMLAVLFMLLDHIYFYFFSPSVGSPLILTCIGRSAYPVFLFCMIWGYHNIFLNMFWVGLLISTIETFQKDRKKGGIMLGAIFTV